MEQKRLKRKSIKYILFGIIAITLVIAIIFAVLNSFKTPKIDEVTIINPVADSSIEIVERSDDKEIDLFSIIAENERDILIEQIIRQEMNIDFNTQYRENSSLQSGQMQTIQQGKDGKQDAITRCAYKNGQLISTSLISSVVTESSVDKIVEIGTSSVASTYVPIVGDKLQVIVNGTVLHVTSNEESQEVATLAIGEEVEMKQKEGDWFYVSKGNYVGWLKSNQVQYINPNNDGDGDENRIQYTREQLSSTLGFSMLLNTRSGLSLEQFKHILSGDSNDKNHIFEQNAEYFYFIEQQYNINGVFVAAVGIHESAFGTSYLATTKKNLFGYGAYDRDPVNSANNFNSYSGSIDLLARVFQKYYLNPKGTVLADGEIAQGTYYHGATLTAVNQCYASDKNWARGVYRWMTYLYNKI